MPTAPLALLAVAGLATAGLVVAGAAQAGADEDLAKARNCLACHTLERQASGPSYRAVARRYAGQNGAPARLAEKILKGGAGVWGPLPMPPNATVKPDEAGRLASWILGLK